MIFFDFLIQRKIRYARIRPSSRPWFMIFLHIWHRLHIDLPKFTQIGAGSPPNRPWFLILFLNFDFLIFDFLIQHQFLSARASAGGPRAPADPSSIRPWFLIQRDFFDFVIFLIQHFLPGRVAGARRASPTGPRPPGPRQAGVIFMFLFSSF